MPAILAFPSSLQAHRPGVPGVSREGRGFTYIWKRNEMKHSVYSSPSMTYILQVCVYCWEEGTLSETILHGCDQPPVGVTRDYMQIYV